MCNTGYVGKKAFACVGQVFAMPVFALVEAIISFEKLSSDAELQEMLCGLKKTDLVQLCKRSGLKSSGNKPELIGRVLEKWSDNSVSVDEDEESTGAVASLRKTRVILEQAKD